jgi:hypothetical protein
MENFLKNIVTGDETWVYEYDVETTVQSSQWVSKTFSQTEKSAPSSIKRQGHVDCFFPIMKELSIIHLYVPHGQTLNKEYYVEVLKSLREAV